jgi:hypothetical protein
MDNFYHAPHGYSVLPLREYTSEGNLPDNFYKMFKYYITKFWRITKGYHGDISVDNIAVMYKNSNTKVRKFIFFDYGSHKKFKTYTNKSTGFENFVKIINKEFTKSYSKPTVIAQLYPYLHKTNAPTTQVRIVQGKGQPRRSNTNMLRAYSARGTSYQPQYSIMGHIFPENYSRRVRNAPKNYKKGITHLLSHVTQGNYNNSLYEHATRKQKA